MDKQQHQFGQHHHRRGDSRHAISHVAHGHTAGIICDIVIAPTVCVLLLTNVVIDGQVRQPLLVYTCSPDAPDTLSGALPLSSHCPKLHIRMQLSYSMQQLP